MIDSIKAWLESAIIEQEAFTPEKHGAKRLIYANYYQAPLASLFIDPPPTIAPPWSAIKGETLTNSFFIKLQTALEGHECWWFFVASPQNEYFYLQGVGSVDDQAWGIRKLYAFENIGSDGGSQILGLVIGEQHDLLTIELNNGLEIAFYGDNSLWQRIATLLAIKTDEQLL